MTLTAGLSGRGEMPTWVENAVSADPGGVGAKVNMVFDPGFGISRMSDEARVASTCGERPVLRRRAMLSVDRCSSLDR